MTHGNGSRTLCSELDRLERIEEEVAAVRAMIVGKTPEENNGLRKDVRSIADSLREFRAENKFLKWGISALLMMKTPEAVDLLTTFVKRGFR